MTERLEQTLSKVIEKSLELAEKTGDFVIDQAPDLLQQFYAWHTSIAIIYGTLGALLIIYAIFATPRFCRLKLEGAEALLIVFAGVTPGIAGIIIFLVNLHNLIYISVAPKLYLIEYFIN